MLRPGRTPAQAVRHQAGPERLVLLAFYHEMATTSRPGCPCHPTTLNCVSLLLPRTLAFCMNLLFPSPRRRPFFDWRPLLILPPSQAFIAVTSASPLLPKRLHNYTQLRIIVQLFTSMGLATTDLAPLPGFHCCDERAPSLT